MSFKMNLSVTTAAGKKTIDGLCAIPVNNY